MRVKLTYSAMISTAALSLVGCGAFTDGVSDTALIPPSANYQANYVPLQPPTPMYGNMGNMMPQPQMSAPVAIVEDTTPRIHRVNNMVVDKIEVAELPEPVRPAPSVETQMAKPSANNNNAEMGEPLIPNSPMLTPSNVIELNAVGMGVAPETSVSPSQALALAKRAAIVDAYRQIGEKMYGIRVNGQDTVKDMMLQNSVVKTKVQALIRNAEITETVYKDGLCQVSMELKLDGKIWHKVLSGNL